jgi:hypothetical protein
MKMMAMVVLRNILPKMMGVVTEPTIYMELSKKITR